MEHKLKTLKVALGYDCNMSCGFCLQQDKDKAQSLSNDDIDKIMLDDTVRDDVDLIVITGGEPLYGPYRDKALRIVKKASGWGKETCIFTNGDFLHSDVIEEFSDCGLSRFRVSLYDPIDWVRIYNLMENLSAHGLPRMAKYTVTKENITKLMDVLYHVKHAGIEWFQIKPYNRIEVPEIDEKYELIPAQVEMLARVMVQFRKRNPDIKVDLLPLCYEFLFDDTLTADDLSVCHCGQTDRGYLVVDPTGDIKICGAYPDALGNIRTDTLSRIWKEHPLLKLMREKTKPEECGECGHWDKCSATDCHSATYAKYGNFKHGNPQCPIIRKKELNGLST